MLIAIICAAGCKVETQPSDDQLKKQADAKKNADTAVVPLPVPTNDDAALVIAACGPAASDQLVNLDKNYGTVRRMVYRGSREVTLNFLPLQTGTSNSGSGHAAASSNTVWRFNEALVENQKLLTAANIRVYLPCAANALAKEF